MLDENQGRDPDHVRQVVPVSSRLRSAGRRGHGDNIIPCRDSQTKSFEPSSPIGRNETWCRIRSAHVLEFGLIHVPTPCLATRGSIPLTHVLLEGHPRGTALQYVCTAPGARRRKRQEVSANRNNGHIANNYGPVRCHVGININHCRYRDPEPQSKICQGQGNESQAHSTKVVIIEEKVNQNGCSHDSGVT